MTAFAKNQIVTSSQDLPELQERLQRTPGLHMAVLDYSDRATQGVDQISFPKAAPVSSQNAAAAMTLASQSYGLDVLQLSIERGHRFNVKRALKKESRIDIITDQLNAGLTAILNDRDQSIHDAMVAGSGEEVVYTSDIVADIIEARKKLKDAKAWTNGEMYLALNTSDFAKVLKSPLFQSAEKLAGSMNPAVDGVVGMISGFRVIEHNMESSLAFNRKAAVYADHGQLEIGSTFDTANVADEFAASLKYGVKVLQDGACIVKFVVTATP